MSSADNQAIEDEQRYRASAYALLAALLRAAPEQALLDHVSTLLPGADVELDELGEAMAQLAAAAQGHDVAQLEQEYNDLFINKIFLS